jgi:hypothetical protein
VWWTQIHDIVDNTNDVEDATVANDLIFKKFDYDDAIHQYTIFNDGLAKLYGDVQSNFTEIYGIVTVLGPSNKTEDNIHHLLFKPVKSYIVLTDFMLSAGLEDILAVFVQLYLAIKISASVCKYTNYNLTGDNIFIDIHDDPITMTYKNPADSEIITIRTRFVPRITDYSCSHIEKDDKHVGVTHRLADGVLYNKCYFVADFHALLTITYNDTTRRVLDPVIEEMYNMEDSSQNINLFGRGTQKDRCFPYQSIFKDADMFDDHIYTIISKHPAIQIDTQSGQSIPMVKTPYNLYDMTVNHHDKSFIDRCIEHADINFTGYGRKLDLYIDQINTILSTISIPHIKHISPTDRKCQLVSDKIKRFCRQASILQVIYRQYLCLHTALTYAGQLLSDTDEDIGPIGSLTDDVKTMIDRISSKYTNYC